MTPPPATDRALYLMGRATKTGSVRLSREARRLCEDIDRIVREIKPIKKEER